jgi:hypothetical protein
MWQMASVFFFVLTPILTIAALGFLAVRLRIVDDKSPRAFSAVALYFLLPALTFVSIASAQLTSKELFVLFLAAWIVAAAQSVLGWGIGRKFDSATKGALLLSVVAVNAGNFGIPVNKFAFGDESVAYATIYYVAWTMFMQTVGLFIAAGGSRDLRASIEHILRLPLPYARMGDRSSYLTPPGACGQRRCTRNASGPRDGTGEGVFWYLPSESRLHSARACHGDEALHRAYPGLWTHMDFGA